jgi:tetratricopeptide (TPR) repeat protein/predicted Ser/Thr protein kinase
MAEPPDRPADRDLPIDPSTETFLLGRDALAEPRRDRADALERGSAIGRYLILDRVGEGGMGVVYAAHDPELDRKVAIKLLRPDRTGVAAEEHRLRLQREAQAIARLSDPNVVAVYDAGTFGEQVFVAMEFVEGQTLRQWLAEESRSWREIVAVFLAAGRGLAAAHAAGLAHRDFKPDNVLLGRDGRVKVADFGLARPAGEADAGIPRDGFSTSFGGNSSGGNSSVGILATPLTQWGTALGTPAYMAPEQLRGEAADARSDQFSFCVSLWEALYGERPFAGNSSWKIAGAVASGTVRSEPARSRVPGRVRQALLRGLAADPGRRFPAMMELLHELERDPSAVRRRWLAAAAAVLVTGAVFSSLGYLQARRDRLCGGGEEALAGVWDAGRKQAVRAAFLATGLPFAEGVWRGVEKEIDGYTGDWVATRRRACEATHVRGEQSEDLLDRKMFCLDQRLRDVQALTAVFARADAKVVEKAADAVSGLGDLSRCTQAASLLEKVPPPGDPKLRARVRGVQAELATASALHRSGKPREALPLAEALSLRAMAVPYPPLQAEALYLLGSLHLSLGDFKTSEEELYRALWAAERARDDLLKAECWRELVYNVGYRQARFDEGRTLARHAEAALARAGGDLTAEAALAKAEAILAGTQGDYPQAVRQFEKARELAERIDPRQPDYRILGNLGGTYRDMGDFERAQLLLRRAMDLAQRKLGPNHPHVAGFCFNLGLCLSDLGRFEEAGGLLERALAIRERLLGPDHPDVASALMALGGNWIYRGKPATARPLLERALAIYEAREPRTPEGWAMAHHKLGEADRALRRYGEALEHERQAIRMMEEALGPESDYLLEPLETVGGVYLDQGRPALAIPPLERALKIYDRQPPTLARWSSSARFELARALWDSGQDRERALTLARQASESYRKFGEKGRTNLAGVETWLARHAG